MDRGASGYRCDLAFHVGLFVLLRRLDLDHMQTGANGPERNRPPRGARNSAQSDGKLPDRSSIASSACNRGFDPAVLSSDFPCGLAAQGDCEGHAGSERHDCGLPWRRRRLHRNRIAHRATADHEQTAAAFWYRCRAARAAAFADRRFSDRNDLGNALGRRHTEGQRWCLPLFHRHIGCSASLLTRTREY